MTSPISFPEVLDSSLIADYKQCPQLFFRRNLQHYKPRDASVHLHAGGAFAKGVEVARLAFFCGELHEGVVEKVYSPNNELVRETTEWKVSACPPGDTDLAIAAGLKALLFSYGDFNCPADSAKSAERMAGAFEFYFENYPLAEDQYPPVTLPSGRRGIEFNFVEPLPISHPETGMPLLYCGRMDALVAYAGGTYIMDEKTTTSLGATWGRQFDLRSQFTGYAWGCRRAGIKVDG